MRNTVKELVNATGGSLILGDPGNVFRNVSIDTRTLAPGDAFFALKGPRFDGHDFLRAASSRHAAVAVIDALDERATVPEARPYDIVLVRDGLAALQKFGAARRSQSGARVIGITGSNGKTTTKEMLASILRLSGSTLATRGNLNNHIGLPLTCCELQPEHHYAVIEMGTSKPGDMALLVDIAKPDVALITNVGKDHLEFLGTPEGVLKENRLLYDRLPKDGVAVVNVDDPLLAPLARELSSRVITYGMVQGDATISAEQIQPWPLPMRFVLRLEDRRLDATLEVPGAFQVMNALAAAAVAHGMGVPDEQIVEGLRRFTPAAMRMQLLEGPAGAVFINDAYNANPSSVRASVESFCQLFVDRPRWLVLGDMRELGAVAREEHRKIGEWLAAQPVDRIFLYGRDSRFLLEGLSATQSKTPVERYKKKRDLIRALETQIPSRKPAVLFKASRSLRLEDALAALAPGQASVKGH